MIQYLQDLLKTRPGAVPVWVLFVDRETGQDYIMTDVDSVGIVLASAAGSNSRVAYPWSAIASVKPGP